MKVTILLWENINIQMSQFSLLDFQIQFFLKTFVSSIKIFAAEINC